MKPIKFNGQNCELGPPAGMTTDQVTPLPVFRDGMSCTSCWELTPEERCAIANGANIMLTVHGGQTQPPVSMQVSHAVNLDDNSLESFIERRNSLREDLILAEAEQDWERCARIRDLLAEADAHITKSQTIENEQQNKA